MTASIYFSRLQAGENPQDGGNNETVDCDIYSYVPGIIVEVGWAMGLKPCCIDSWCNLASY